MAGEGMAWERRTGGLGRGGLEREGLEGWGGEGRGRGGQEGWGGEGRGRKEVRDRPLRRNNTVRPEAMHHKVSHEGKNKNNNKNIQE